MSRVAFLFPGQGAKRVHEALRASARTDAGRARCEVAARAAGVPLDRVIARPSLLDRTEVLQPYLAAISLAIVDVLGAAGIAPSIVLGHSAGEIAAWSSAGGLAADAAIELCALRGRLMAREAAAHPGGMLALATSDPEAIEAALAVGRKAGALCVAAHNAPDETVLSGDEPALRAVLAFAPGKATRVPTAGAWHSPAMEGALSEWTRALYESASLPLRCELVANRTGEVVSPGQGAPLASPDARPSPPGGGATPRSGDVRGLFAEQLVRPVAWVKALGTLRERADVIVTIGPGAVLRALWHRSFRSPESGVGASRSKEPAGEPDHGDLPGSLPAEMTRLKTTTRDVMPPHPQTLTLLATDDERALAETIFALRGLR